MPPRVILFGRLPRAGRVKTRLVPPLDPPRALALYRAFLTDQLRFLRGFAETAQVEWCTDRLPGAEERRRLAPGVPLTLQGEGDLGRRLRRAFERSHREGSPETVIIGVDSPTLPEGHVRRALDLLRRGTPAVVAPALDGGYVLIGLVRPRAELFTDVPWGGAGVLEATRRRAADADIPLAEIDSWYDVDDAGGLARLREELRVPRAARRAPSTARRLLDWREETVL